jgi:hypothetical protein
MAIGDLNITLIIDTVESFSSIFSSYNSFSVSHVYPALTTALGGNITLYHNYMEMNSHKHQIPDLSCVFGGVVVPSIVVNETAIICVAPPYYSIQGHDSSKLMNGFNLISIGITANRVDIRTVQDDSVTLRLVMPLLR